MTAQIEIADDIYEELAQVAAERSVPLSKVIEERLRGTVPSTTKPLTQDAAVDWKPMTFDLGETLLPEDKWAEAVYNDL